MKICKDCGQEKGLNEFHKTGKWYRNRCKKCHNAKYQPATGKPNLGKFQKGHKPIAGFTKGFAPWNKGKPRILSQESLRKIISSLKGRKHSPEEIEKRRQSLIDFRKKQNNYSGTRRSKLSRQWSIDVRNRDMNKCQKCASTEKLHAHHIKSWKNNEFLRFNLDNGITYCHSCHQKVEQSQRFNITVV